MKKAVILVAMSVWILSCSKIQTVQQEFNCNLNKLENTQQLIDFNKNFKIDIPTHWKTKLYYTKNQSEIYTADTTIQLTKTFILNTSFNKGELDFTPIFITKTDSVIANKQLVKIKSGKITSKAKPSYWFLTKGTKNGFTFHQFSLLIKVSESTYFSAVIDIYGENNIEERICESLVIIDSLEFL